MDDDATVFPLIGDFFLALGVLYRLDDDDECWTGVNGVGGDLGDDRDNALDCP